MDFTRKNEDERKHITEILKAQEFHSTRQDRHLEKLESYQRKLGNLQVKEFNLIFIDQRVIQINVKTVKDTLEICLEAYCGETDLSMVAQTMTNLTETEVASQITKLCIQKFDLDKRREKQPNDLWSEIITVLRITSNIKGTSNKTITTFGSEEPEEIQNPFEALMLVWDINTKLHDATLLEENHEAKQFIDYLSFRKCETTIALGLVNFARENYLEHTSIELCIAKRTAFFDGSDLSWKIPDELDISDEPNSEDELQLGNTESEVEEIEE